MSKRNKNNTLKANWNKKEKDIMFSFPLGSQTVSDAHLLHYFFNVVRDLNNDNSLIKELKERGYDIKTLTFSILKEEDHSRWHK
jgi:hypothetical protein